ncbi:MAG: glycosyl transferase family 2 [Verrucomicrobiales bacterium]|nr:glycosyl transferase family 2 [Verrucomicrobiales bacterium]
MKPSVALIINTYQQPEYLARVLNAVSRQRELPDEVWVAEDDTHAETAEVFATWHGSHEVRGGHVRQQHDGFRRAKILNEAIASTNSDYVVFLDGDTVPHSRFISDHRELAEPKMFVQGHRALIEQKAAKEFGKNSLPILRTLLTGQLRGLQHTVRWPVPQKRVLTNLKGIRGCNLGIWRNDLVAINGYNEAFVGWGREDSELAVRLLNTGVQRLDVRGRALCFHLWHPPASRARLTTNDDLLQKAIDTKSHRCEMGLDKHKI